MNPLPLLLLPLLSGLSASPTGIGDVSLFEYAPATTGPEGNVRVIDETGVAPDAFPVGLQGIVLLPLDFVGRTTWELLRADRPRLRETLAAPRVRLAEGRGALYAYRRDELEKSVFGYFLVDATGTPRVLLERDGSGVGRNVNPFCPKFAAEAAGAGVSLLFATLPAAGGDLIEIDVDSGDVQVRSDLLEPLTIQTNGLALLAGWGLASTPEGILRFERTPGSQARRVPFGGGVAARAAFPSGSVTDTRSLVPAWFGPDLVTSTDGSTAAFCAGVGPTQSFVYAVHQSGRAMRITSQAAHLSGAGFLPEAHNGPTLALAPDGSCVAWRAQDAVSAETFVERIATPLAAPLQLTADANYSDTLNDSGVITFASPDDLIILVGETDNNDPLQIDQADLYRVDLTNLASPTFANLSMTSGDGVVPFLLPGNLDTDAGLVRTPDGTRALALAESSGSGVLLELELASAQVTTLFDQVKEWNMVAASGNDLVLSLRRDFGPLDQELHRWSPGAAPALVFAQSGGGYFDWSLRPDGFAGIAADGMGGETLGRVEFSSGFAESMAPVPVVGPTLDHTSSGALAFSMDGPGQSFFFLWQPDSSITQLHFAAGIGLLLPRD